MKSSFSFPTFCKPNDANAPSYTPAPQHPALAFQHTGKSYFNTGESWELLVELFNDFASVFLFLIPIINVEEVILEAYFKHFISGIKEF